MSNRHPKYDLRFAARSFLFFLALAMALPVAAAAQPASRCSLTQQYPVGAVFTLDNTPHLWLFAGADGIRWVGDTRALASAGIPVRWDVTCGMDTSFIAQVKKGDPILSAGLVKIGDPISLAKWEQTDAAPTLLHVSRGLAGIHPTRLNCPPELPLLILKAGQ